MFPLYDDNPIVRPPVVTVAIIVLNTLAWILLQGWGHESFLLRSLCNYGLIPAELLGKLAPGSVVPLGQNAGCVVSDSAWYTPLTSMFMHGGWLHIIGNMWFLWIFGDNIEDATGAFRFLVFYLLCGLAAAAAQIAVNPSSAVPMVGASGAIGGVMGAYLRLYPSAHVHTLIFLGFFITTIAVPAWVMLGYWFVLQLVSGLPAIGGTSGGVAFWAHVGGFVAGLLLIGPLHKPAYLAEQRRRAPRQRPRRRF